MGMGVMPPMETSCRQGLDDLTLSGCWTWGLIYVSVLTHSQMSLCPALPFAPASTDSPLCVYHACCCPCLAHVP